MTTQKFKNSSLTENKCKDKIITGTMKEMESFLSGLALKNNMTIEQVKILLKK